MDNNKQLKTANTAGANPSRVAALNGVCISLFKRPLFLGGVNPKQFKLTRFKAHLTAFNGLKFRGCKC